MCKVPDNHFLLTGPLIDFVYASLGTTEVIDPLRFSMHIQYTVHYVTVPRGCFIFAGFYLLRNIVLVYMWCERNSDSVSNKLDYSQFFAHRTTFCFALAVHFTYADYSVAGILFIFCSVYFPQHLLYML